MAKLKNFKKLRPVEGNEILLGEGVWIKLIDGETYAEGLCIKERPLSSVKLDNGETLENIDRSRIFVLKTKHVEVLGQEHDHRY